MPARKERRQAWWKTHKEKQNSTETSTSAINLRVRKPPEEPRQAAVVETAGGFKLKLRLAGTSVSPVKSSKKVSKKSLSTQNGNKPKTKTKTSAAKVSSKSQNLSSPKKKPGPKPKIPATENSSGSEQSPKPKASVLKYVLFVGNLPFDVTQEQLLDHFRKTGGTVKVRIPKEKGTEQGKGYAFVEFRDRISYRVGLRLHETTLGGRKINVEFTSIGGNNTKRREKLKAKNEALKKFKMPLDGERMT